MLVPMFCRTSVFPLLCAALLSLSSVPSVMGAENASLPDNPMPIVPRNSPVSVEHEGDDALGARLSTRLKELLNGSSLFQLQEKDTPKFRILLSSSSEFRDRPAVGSAYSVVWVFSLSDATLRHYLAREVGVLTPEQVDDIAARLVERTDNLAVRYSYLFPKPKSQPSAQGQSGDARKSDGSAAAADRQEK